VSEQCECGYPLVDGECTRRAEPCAATLRATVTRLRASLDAAEAEVRRLRDEVSVAKSADEAERGNLRDAMIRARAEATLATRRADAAERVVEAARRLCDVEPQCNCGELAPGPCCVACEAERDLRAALRAFEAGREKP